jgi:hypothetical protein
MDFGQDHVGLLILLQPYKRAERDADVSLIPTLLARLSSHAGEHG